MNSKDLRAIAHVERLTKMGVHSLKIEGRTKSFYYCARTAQVYRKAIDDAAAGKPFDPTLLETLEGLAHRGYTVRFPASPYARRLPELRVRVLRFRTPAICRSSSPASVKANWRPWR